MAEAFDGRFACPSCGKQYKWSSRLAGRKVKCACGAMLRVSAEPGGEIILLNDSASASPLGHTSSQSDAAAGSTDIPSSREDESDGGQDAQTYELADDSNGSGSDQSPPPRRRESDKGPPTDSPLSKTLDEFDPYELALPEENNAPPRRTAARPVEPAPADDAALHDGQGYELADDDEFAGTSQSAVGGRCPHCNQAIDPDAVICIHCGFHLRQGEHLRTKTADDRVAASAAKGSVAADGPDAQEDQRSLVDQQKQAEEPAYVNAAVAAARRDEARKQASEQYVVEHYHRLNFTYPLYMMLSGPVIIIIGAILLRMSLITGLEAAVVIAAMELLIMTPLLVISTIIGAMLLKLEFGEYKQVIFKCAAICVGPGALADLISLPLLAFTGFLLPVFLYLGFIGIPLSKLFDLDFQETALMVLIVVLVRVAAFILIFATIYDLLW